MLLKLPLVIYHNTIRKLSIKLRRLFLKSSLNLKIIKNNQSKYKIYYLYFLLLYIIKRFTIRYFLICIFIPTFRAFLILINCANVVRVPTDAYRTVYR